MLFNLNYVFQERHIDKLYGMVASMSADLMHSMPLHVTEESEPAQSSQIDTDIENQGKKWFYSFRLLKPIQNIDPSPSNQSQDVDMLESDNNGFQIDTEMTDLNLIESESDLIRIAEARLAAMQDGESEIGKLNYIKEINASLNYFRS